MSGTALSRDPAAEEEFVASLYKGGELLAANKVVEAREHLEKANRLNPKNEKAQNLLGLAYFKLGLFDQASEVYEALVRENPADPTLRVNLGLVYLKTNNLERSVHEFETATDLEPTHKKAHNYLGLALAQAGDYGRARDHFVAAGSDAMAEKMSKALVARVEAAPPTEPMTVAPAPPPSAPTIPVEASVIVSPQASQSDSDDDDIIEVMSDEQEPPSGEMPAVLDAEEVAVELAASDSGLIDVGTGETPIEAEAVSEPGTTLTELPPDAQVVSMSRPSRPNLSATDWGEQLETNQSVTASAQAPAVEAELQAVADGESPDASLVDEDQLIEASEDDELDDRIPVDQYGEPVTAQQFGSSKSDLRRRASQWEQPEERELVSVESMTPEPASEPTSSPNEVPDNSWSAPAPGSDELMAEAALSYVSSGEHPDPSDGQHQTAIEENDWSQSGASEPQPVAEQWASNEAEQPLAEQQWANEPQQRQPLEGEGQELPQWATGPQPVTDDGEAYPSQPPEEPQAAAPAASELDWSNVATTTAETELPAPPQEMPLLEASAAEPEPQATAEVVPDWVSTAPDPLAISETSPAEPEWVSQPLSEVNFTAAGHSVIAKPNEIEPGLHLQAEDTPLSRPTVPTYEPAAVDGPPHVDIRFTPEATQLVTEPQGVNAVPAPSASVPIGYSPMGSQRLMDLGASTQWVAEGERGPFHFGSDGMAVTVHGEMLVRLTNLVAAVGSIEVSPEMRRIRGRPTDQPFGTGEQQLQRVRGAGVLYLEPGRSLFHAIDLDDEGAYLREERVFAFEEPVAFENGRLTDAGKAVDLVNLKGVGRVLLQLDGPLKAMPIPIGSPMVVPLSRLVGWFGRVTPRMVGLVGQGAIELTGEGYALLGAAPERS